MTATPVTSASFLGRAVGGPGEVRCDEYAVSHGIRLRGEAQSKVDGFVLRTAFERIVSCPFLMVVSLNVNMAGQTANIESSHGLSYLKPWVSMPSIGDQNRPTVRREHLFQPFEKSLFHTWVCEPVLGMHLEIQRQRAAMASEGCNQCIMAMGDARPIHQNDGPLCVARQQLGHRPAKGGQIAQKM